jgi:hypothetical protein
VAGGQTRDISWLGPLNQNGGVWAGSISRQLSLDEFEGYKRRLAESFKPVSQSAAMRCIDGRTGDTHQALGPQAAGGGPGFSLAFHIAGGPGSNIVDDFRIFFESHRQTNDHFDIGGHIDDHAKPPFSGCGAIDKMPQILEAMVSTANLAAIERYSQAIIGSGFVPSALKACLTTAKSINPKTYFREHGHSYRHELLNEIRKRSAKKTIEELEGPHKEACAVINLAPNSTLDKEMFAAKTDNKAQAFNYDFWYAAYLSSELFPDDKRKQSTFLAASLAYNIATAMALTDGSLEVGIRQ